MDILIKILQFILSFSILVFVHELGHFAFARMFGIRVEKFYLFFNPWFSLFKKKIGGTEYGIGWLPLGGYVKIAGMIDESMDTEQMKQPAKPDEFRSKPAWQRLLVMVGGVMMNVLFAMFIYMGVSYVWGKNYIANEDIPYGYTFNPLAHEIGFENGDKILDIAGNKVEDFSRVMPMILIDQAPYVTVERGGQPLRIEISEDQLARMLHEGKGFALPRVPFVVATVRTGGAEAAGLMAGDSLVSANGAPLLFLDQYTEVFGANKGQSVNIGLMRDSAGVWVPRSYEVQVSDEGTIGVGLADFTRYAKISTVSYSFWESIPAGVKLTGEELSSYAKQLKLLVSPKSEGYKALGGILTIGSIFPGEWNWEGFWLVTAFISIVLAVMNILPIPALDGGHVLFLLVEVITGRRPSDKFLEWAQMVGLFILFALLILANANDIYRFFIK